MGLKRVETAVKLLGGLSKLFELLSVAQADGQYLGEAAMQIEHVEHWVAEGRAVEGVGIGGIEIDEPAQFLRMTAACRTELDATERVADEDGTNEVKCVGYGEYVVAEAVRGVVAAIGGGGA